MVNDVKQETLSSIRSLVLVAAATVSSAWTFTGFEHAGFGGQQFILTGLPLPDPACQNVPDHFKGLLSAFKWESGVDIKNYKCTLTLFTGSDCSGDTIYSTTAVMVEREYVGATYNDKTSSIQVTCTAIVT